MLLQFRCPKRKANGRRKPKRQRRRIKSQVWPKTHGRKTGNTKAGKRKTRKWILRKSRFSSPALGNLSVFYSSFLLFSFSSFSLCLSVSPDDSKAIKLAFRYGTDPIRVCFDVHATVSVEAASKEKRSWLWFENLRRWF